MPKLLKFLLISVFFTGLYFIISTIKLDAQGLYYDEVNFAPPALTLKGINADYSFSTSFKGFPVFIISYQGAVMSYPYGIYLKLFNQNFSVISWRLYGIIIWSVAIVIFSIYNARFIKPYQLVIFLAFLLTDNSIILAIRFHQGPVLIPLITVLIIISIAFRIFNGKKLKIWEFFILGFCVGLAIYAKFSSYPLIMPFFLILIYLLIKKPFYRKGILIAISGLIVGIFPVILYNLRSLIQDKNFFSFLYTESTHLYSIKDLGNKFYLFITGSSGIALYPHIFGESLPYFFEIKELFFNSLFILFNVIAFLTFYKNLNLIPFFSTVSWIISFLILYFSPMDISTRHTIIAVPFLYLSIALFWEILDKNLNEQRNYVFRCILVIFVIWMTLRMINTLQIVQSFVEGKYSISFHPEYTKLGKFASLKADDSVFLTADWGFAHQIFLLTNGKERTVYQLNFNYQGTDDLINVIRESKKSYIYIISYKNDENSGNPDIPKRILYDAATVDFLKPVQIESDLSEFKIINVKKYQIVSEKL